MNELACAPVAAARSSVVIRALRILKREPILFVTLGYLLVSFIGIWANYWFYSRFGLPILDYMQGSDYLSPVCASRPTWRCSLPRSGSPGW